MEMPNVVAAENLLQLLDPLVLGVDGEVEPRGPGDGDNFLQKSIDKLISLKSSETRRFNRDGVFQQNKSLR